MQKTGGRKMNMYDFLPETLQVIAWIAHIALAGVAIFFMEKNRTLGSGRGEGSTVAIIYFFIIIQPFVVLLFVLLAVGALLTEETPKEKMKRERGIDSFYRKQESSK